MIALYRKYRPKLFSEIVGQEQVKTTLQNALKNNRIVQTYLFCGPRGTGKTTTARIFAKALNCPNRVPDTAEPCGKCDICLSVDKGTHMDLIEIDAASNRKIDNIRELNENIKFSPSHKNHHKIYIIDESHMLTKEASNAFLKNLEEPPKNVVFILATTNPEKMIPTILSRVQRLDFFPISAQNLRQKLDLIVKKEKVSIDPQTLDMIVMQAMGGARDAESILGKLISFSQGNINQDLVDSILGKNPFWESYRFLESLSQPNSLSSSLALLHKIYHSGYNLTEFTKLLLINTRKVFLFQISPSLLPQDSLLESELKLIENLSKSLTPHKIQNILNLFADNLPKINTSIIPVLPLEMATVGTLADTPPVILTTPPIQTTSNTPNNEKLLFSAPAHPIKEHLAPTPTPKVLHTLTPPAPVKKSAKQPKKSLREMLEISDTVKSSTSDKKTSLTLEHLLKEKNTWLQIIKRDNHTIALQLENAVLADFSGSTLLIVVESDFHRGRLEKYTSKIEQILSDFYHQTILIKFSKNDSNSNNTTSNATSPATLDLNSNTTPQAEEPQKNKIEDDINEIFGEFL
jgi:DNA polymerase-3 subunit gamma/tau